MFLFFMVFKWARSQNGTRKNTFFCDDLTPKRIKLENWFWYHSTAFLMLYQMLYRSPLVVTIWQNYGSKEENNEKPDLVMIKRPYLNKKKRNFSIKSLYHLIEKILSYRMVYRRCFESIKIVVYFNNFHIFPVPIKAATKPPAI